MNEKQTDKSKPSFLIYKSFFEPIRHLKDEELGLLFRAIFDYQNGLKIENLPSQIGMAFAFFKNQFDLDAQKYQVVLERNKSNGSKGGRPKKEETQANPENPVGFYEPKKAEKDKDKDKDKGIKNEQKKSQSNFEKEFEKFWQNYHPVKTKEGKVIDKGSKKAARIAYEKALRAYSADQIFDGTQDYLLDCFQNNRLTCQVSVMLNQERFVFETCKTLNVK